MRPRIFAVLLVLLGVVARGDALAQKLQPRMASHPGYGRMVFDWSGPVTNTARIEGGNLIVTFDRPLQGEVGGLPGPLDGYVRGVQVSPDKKTLVFPLAGKGAFKVRTFTSDGAVVVDISDSDVAAPSPSPSPSPTPSPAKATPAPPAESAVRVPVRVGDHKSFHRVVFDWPVPAPYDVKEDSGRAVVTFAKSGRINVEQARRGLPDDLSSLEVTTEPARTVVTLAMPPGGSLHHYRSGNVVVVDVIRPKPGAVPPKPPKSADPVQVAAAPTPITPPAASPPPAAPAKVAPPQVSVPVFAPPGPSSAEPPVPKAAPVIPVRVAEPAAPEAVASQDGEDGEPAPSSRRTGLQGNKVVSLGFSWSQPVAAAVFARSGYVWAVFDRAQEVDVKLLRRLGGEVVQTLEQIPHKSATVVRILPQPGYNPSVRREGLLWVVDLSRQPQRPKTLIQVKPEPESSAGPRVVLQVAEPGTVLSLPDPMVGDTLSVIPVMPLGNGISPARSYPDFDLLASVQGIAMLRRAEQVSARPSRNGVEISAGGAGLHLSHDLGPSQSKEKAMERVFDIKNWVHGGDQNFTKARRGMEAAAAAVARPEGRQGPRLELARFQFANGNASDALGVLQVMAGDDPSIVNAAAFRGLRGAVNVLLYRFEEAVEDLSHPSLANDDEAAFWRAAAEASLGNPELQAETLREKAGALKDYPRRLKTRLALIGAEAAIAAADDMSARNFLDLASLDGATAAEKAGITYWTGRLNELTGAFDLAISNWEEVESGLDRLNRARSALARLELQLKMDRITPADAVEGMEKLRFAWRGDAFEYNLLKRLGELQIAAGDYGGGLRTFKQLVVSYGDNPETPKIADTMRETFDKLYLTKAVESLPPVTAIALFDEFKELTPTGEKGDEMIRRLADRLVSVDLLERAGSLLDNQVKFRLSGLEKAKVGTRLALVHLLNRKPQKAIDAMTVSELPGMSPELTLQRRHLTARALADMGKTEDGIALLAGDKSEDGRLLAVEIHWKNKNWAEAAVVLESLVDKPKRGEKVHARQTRWILDCATALTLAKDERGVSRLRRQYLDGLVGSDVYDAFNLITTGAEKGILDYRQVAGKLKLAEGFKAFMGSYGDRLKKGQLSGIN